MNILVFGHSGVGRKKAVAAFVTGLASAVPRTGHRTGKTDQEIVPSVFLEDNLGIDVVSFLDIHDRRDQQRLSNEAATKSIKILLRHTLSEHRVLVLHGTFCRHSRIFSCLDPTVLIENNFLPDVAITLIDDVYNVQGRLEFTPDSPDWLRLRELIAWRSVEISAADLFLRCFPSTHSGPKNFVLGIRHSVKSAVELILHPEKPAIYSGHPISYVRKQPPKDQTRIIEEIEKIFKEPLKNFGPVLNPTTIDELILVRLYEKAGAKKHITLQQREHWPTNMEKSLGCNVPYPDEIRISRDEIREAIVDISKLVDWRDYRLMDQADCLVSYRPTMGGAKERHGGVEAEFRFAQQTGMPNIALLGPKDKKLRYVFQYVSKTANNMEEVKSYLESERVPKSRRFKMIN